ncbi:MAG: hypothetical protein MJY93_08420 [Fibrobacter sp.]|nr:hypothetical protein [Fibrobacter sp.]
MSLLPGEPLHYAETHFKFKLPWSLLYKPWPEILVDAPFQFVPGVKPMLWIVVRDAHRFPTTIESIEIEVEGDGNPVAGINGNPVAGIKDNPVAKTVPLAIEAKEQFAFYPVEIGDLEPGHYKIHCKISASREIKGKRKTRTFTRWNFPGLDPQPLKVHVLREMPPEAPGFAYGEMHCHTHYSADHVEHGATPAVFQQAAKAVGLDFVSCTDHAYDFAFLTEDYTKEASSPLPRFDALRAEVAELNKACKDDAENGSKNDANSMPLLVVGEEVSAGNSKGENVHVTVMGPDGYLPGLGDCGRNWLDNKPTLKIEKILQMTDAHCFAAHPHQQMGLLEKFIFRRGYWESKDLHSATSHPIRGIQFWNGLRDEGFKLGREWWIQELGKGNFVLPIGGNDAHGDLNDTTAVSLPLFTLKHSRHHVFGNVRTAVKLPDATCANEAEANATAAKDAAATLNAETLRQAFAGDNCFITDGPALWWERVADSVEGRPEGAVAFHARSTEDFGGGFRFFKIYGRRRLLNGKLAPREELHLASQVAARPATDITVDFEDYAYLRAECITATGKYALTSAAVNPRR